MTKQEYQEYQDAFARWTKGLYAVSSGECPGCEECGLSEDPTDEEREVAGERQFSCVACEFCGGLPGDRYPAHALLNDPETTKPDDNPIMHFSICPDCVYYLAYGQLDDMTMIDMEGEES